MDNMGLIRTSNKRRIYVRDISRILCQNAFFGSRGGSVHVDVEKQDIVTRKGLKDVEARSETL